MKKYSLLSFVSLMLAGVLAAQSYKWTPDGTASGTVGGSGTWSNATPAWWNGSTALASNSGTLIGTGGATAVTLNLDGSGTITKVGATAMAGTGTAVTNNLKFGANGHYTFLGDGTGQSRIEAGNSKWSINIVPSSTLTIGGDGKFIAIDSSLLKPNDATGFAFTGGGLVELRSGAFMRVTAGNGIAAVRDEGRMVMYEGSMFAATNGNTTTPSANYAGFHINKGSLEINGGLLVAGYHMAPEGTRRGGLVIGAATSYSCLFTLNSGTVKAIGNPTANNRGDAGILFSNEDNKGQGGVADLNGGVLIVTNIRAQVGGASMAHLNFNGVTLMPTTEVSLTGNDTTITTAHLNNRLDRFLGDGTDFSDATYRRVFIGAGGVLVDTSLIDASITKGYATINTGMTGIGDFSLTGTNAIRFSKVQQYTGATKVLQGTLMLNAAYALATSSTVYVASGATLKANDGSAGTAGTWFAQKLNNLSGAGLVQLRNAIETTTFHNTELTVFTGTIDVTTNKIVKTGAGTLELGEIPDISQTTLTISEGAIRGNAAMLSAALPTHPTLINNSYLDFYQASGTQVVSTSAMRGTGGIMKSGAGMIEISDLPATFSNILIAEGALRANDVVLAAPIINNARLYFDQAAGETKIVVNHLISGSGVIEKNGAGTLELNSTPSSLTSINVISGTLRANAGGIETVINNSAHLEFYQAADTTSTRSHTVTGGGALTKTGAGTVKLAASAAAGSLRIHQGSLLLTNGVTLTAPAFHAQANTVLGGHGSIVGSGTIQNATLRAGDFGNTGAPTALTVNGNLAFDNAILEFLLINNGTQSTQFNYTGSALDPTKVTINIVGAYSGTYNLGNIGSLETAVLTANGQLANVRQGGVIDNIGGNLILKAANDYSRYVTWNNSAATGHWNVVDENWAGTNSTKTYAPGDTVIINNTAAPATITIDSKTTLSGLEINTTRDLTLAGGFITTNTSFAPGEITNPTGKLVKTGAATLTLSGTIANNFTQGIDLAEGTLAFTHGNQLMSDSAAGITFTGSTTLRAAANDLAVATNITVPAGITATIDSASGTLALAGKLNTAANATFAKTGAGVLIIDTTNDVTAHLGLTVVQQGTLALSAAFSSTATWRSPVTGAGAFEKNGLGVLVLAAPLANAGAANVSAGTLRLGSANLLNPLSAHTISAGATLDMAGFSQTMGSLNNNGTITFAATINNKLGYIIDMQTLTVNGDVSGNGTLFVTMTDASATQTAGDPRRTILSVGGNNTADYTLALDRRYASGAFDWQLVREGNSYVLGRDVPPEIPALGGVDTALTLGTQAAYASISQHLAANRLTSDPDRSAESNLWINTAYQRDEIDTSLYTGAKADTTLIQAGYTNYDQQRNGFSLGFAVDYVRTTIDMDADTGSPSSNTNLYGVNFYLSRHSPVWYFDLHLRVNSATTRIEIPNTPVTEVDSTGYGGSLEAGLNFETKSRWLIQPQAQLIYQIISTDSITDPFNRTYVLSDTETQTFRFGVLLAKTFETKSGQRISPYIRASCVEDFSSPTRISGQASYSGPSSYENDITGTYTLINGGIAWRMTESFSFSADFASYSGGPIKRYNINLGAALRW